MTLIEDAGISNKEELISCMQDRVVWCVRHRTRLKHVTTRQLGSTDSQFILPANAKRIRRHNPPFALIFASELPRVELMRIIRCEFVTSTFVFAFAFAFAGSINRAQVSECIVYGFSKNGNLKPLVFSRKPSSFSPQNFMKE